jgi:hypothetical protein
MSLTVSDIGITQVDYDTIVSTLTTSEVADPVGDAEARETETVMDYTARWQLTPGWINRLVGPLVAYRLYSQMPGLAIPQTVKDGYDRAMKELKEIRAGEFADLLQAAPLPTTVDPSGGGSWGSKRRKHLGD